VGSPDSVGNIGRRFADGFEVGDAWLWSNTTDSGASDINFDTTIKYAGRYSAEMINNNGASYILKSVNSTTTPVIRAYVYVSSHTTANGRLDLVALRNGSSQDIILYRHTDGTLGISNGVSGLTYSSSTQLTLGAWHEVELTATLNASTGTVNAYLDGVAVTGLSQTSLNTGGTLASGYIGTTTSGRAWTAYFDEVAIDRVRPGDAASLYVADSLHVSGTAGVAGTFVVQQSSGTRLFAAYAPGNFVEVGSRTAAASPTYLYVSDWSSAAGGAPTLMGNWASSNSWGVGANSNASDNTLRFGVTNGAGTAAWSTTQSLNAHFAGTLTVQAPSGGSDSSTSMQVKNVAGTNLLTVDTTSTNTVTIGQSGAGGINGKLALGTVTETVYNGNAKLFVGTQPEAAAQGTLDATSLTTIANTGHGAGVPVDGIILQYGGATDGAGFKLSDDGLLLWGAGDESFFQVLDEDNNISVLDLDSSGNLKISDNNYVGLDFENATHYDSIQGTAIRSDANVRVAIDADNNSPDTRSFEIVKNALGFDGGTASGTLLFSVAESGDVQVSGPIDTVSGVTTLQIGETNATDIHLTKNTQISGNFVPDATGTRDLGSANNEWDDLFLADNNGVRLGSDQDATLAYDEATDDRIELSGTNASLFLEDKLGLGKQALTTAAGGVGSESVTVTDSYLGIDVSEDGDTVQISETGAKDGDLLFIVNNDTTAAADTVIIEDIDGQIELSGDANASLDQSDTLVLIYNGTLTAWTQVGGSNN
jgi:hypothetical protein